MKAAHDRSTATGEVSAYLDLAVGGARSGD